MSSKPLFDDDSSSEDDKKLYVNQKFAKEYQTKKQLEELRNNRVVFEDDDDGTGDDDSDYSSDDDSEGEGGVLASNTMNLSLLKTIRAIRTKDKSIYDSSTKFFEPESENLGHDGDEQKSKKKKHFKDVLREQILEQMEEDDEGENNREASKRRREEESKGRLAYDEEQKQIRSAFLNTDNDNEDDGDDLLVVKKKAENAVSDKDLEKEFEMLKQMTSVSKLKDPRGEIENADAFLLDFLKNKKWVDKDNVIVGDSDDDRDDAPRLKSNIIGLNDDDSIEEVDRADDFESKFNFRFEEAQSGIKSGAEFSVINYARSGTMDTLRRKDDSRRQKRLERQERKAAERKAKEEQLRRLKNAKRKELDMKLNEIKKVIGSAQDVDEDALMKLMEGDYDPEKFERLMEETYGENFYEKEEKEWKTDLDVRASLLQDEDGEMLVGEEDVEAGLYDDDQDQNDAEYEEGDDDYYGEEEEELDFGKLPPLHSAVEEKLKSKLQEELYKLDYEDIIDGMPTRFKYRKVDPNNFGLGTHEILLARDTSLKNFVSLKKIAPYRDREYQIGYKQRKKFRDMLKDDMKELATEAVVNKVKDDEATPNQDETVDSRKRRRQKKKKSSETTSSIQDSSNRDEEPSALDSGPKGGSLTEDRESSKKTRRKKKGKKGQKGELEETDLSATKVSKDPSHVTKERIHKVGSKVETKELNITNDIITMESPKVSNESTEHIKDIKKNKKTKKRKLASATESKMEGISVSRLQAYGL